MSNQSAIAQVATNNVVPAFTKEERETLINTIARGATPHELSLFINMCQSAQLNPFLNQIYFIKYGDKANIQISVEGIQAIARRREDFTGFKAAVVKENDQFEADVVNAEVQHKVSGFVARGKTVGAYCIAHRKDFPSVLVLIGKDETKAMENGNNKHMWANYYDDMIQKHAIKRALKLQFGIEIGEDEQPVEPSSSIPTYKPDQSKPVIDMDMTPPKTIEVDEGKHIDPEVEMKNAWEDIRNLSEQLQYSEDDLKTFIKEKTGKTARQLKLPEVIGLRKIMALEIASQQRDQSVDGQASQDDFELFDQP
ncbi:RecT family recombinase [Brevibacillus choshinensis]|uniref:RecT family recombinase n=1 Tax=Brevibacillus choshinensis TaxID=54911 RepID=UPI002E1AEBAC|nr:recombinase RecT [Brevibacillus choshinensis]